MSIAAFKWIPVVLLVLCCRSPVALAQDLPVDAERLQVDAVASFRQARFSEAFGRFKNLADAGHAPSAEMALWMYLNGPTLFDKDWDSTQEQLTAWAQLARQPAPTIKERSYPLTDLEKSFWVCDYAATTGPMDSGTAITCGSVTEALKQHKFGGEFNALLAWWQQHKQAEHLGLAKAGSLSVARIPPDAPK